MTILMLTFEIKTMCFKWFKRKKEIVHPMKKVLSFVINDYPGSQNDLNGCVNDQTTVKENLEKIYSSEKGYIIETYKDSQVTVANFKKVLKDSVEQLIAGDLLTVHYSGHGTYVPDRNGDEADGYDEALYLYDGPLVDDDIGEILQGIPEGATVIILLDSCFSGTATRSLMRKRKSVKINDKMKVRPKVRKRFAKSVDMNWITFSGSGEHQTSADAYIEGDYHGAFTWYAFKVLNPLYTYRLWCDATRAALNSAGYSQIPQIEGRDDLLDKPVFQ